MTPDEFGMLREAVQTDEGLKLWPYTDTAGKITIGYGTNLSDGISSVEAAWLLDHRLTNCIAELTQTHPIVMTLTPARQIVLANLAYNLGVPRLSEFHNMWAAIGAGDMVTAAKEMLNSKAATQAPSRYARLAKEFEDGVIA